MKLRATSSLRSSVLLSTVLVAFAPAAFAQTVPTVEPGHIEKRFEQRNLPARTPAPIIQAPRPEAAGGVTAGAGSIQFQLNGVQVEGVTAYAPEEVNAIFAPLKGKRISLADLQRAVNELTTKYRADGYILSKAVLPAQQFGKGNGVVRVQVVEGFVGQVVVEGEQGKRELVRRYLNKIEGNRPLNIKDLERYLLLANDLPGISAKAVLRPSATVGAADVVVTVEQDRFEGSLAADNRGTTFLGPVQFTGIAVANSLLGLNDRTTARAIVTSDVDELTFFDVSHEQQIGTEGTKVKLTVARSDSNPGASLEPLDIEGESTTYGIRAQHPFIRTRTKNLTGNIAFDVRDTKTDLSGLFFSEDKIRAVRVGADFDIADPLGGVTLTNVLMSQGIDALGATDDGAGRTRADGAHDFTKFELSITRRQDLSFGGLSLLAAVTGQYALDPLLSAEEFTVGGLGFGQAYDPSELAGDHGAAFHTELQYGNVLGYRWFDSYQAYVYYDIGAVWQETSAITPDSDQQSLASAGLGLRFNINETFSGSTEIGFPLTRDVAAEGDNNPRFFFSLISRF